MKPTESGRMLSVLEAILILALTFLILYILVEARQHLNIKAESLIEPSWLVLALLPVLLWLIVSDRLTEFSAGSITAKLARVASEPVAKAFDQASIGSQTITEIALSAPDEQLKEALRQRNVILKIKLGVPGYTDEGIQIWVERLLEAGSLQYVAFVDLDSRLVKYIPAHALLFYLRNDGKISERIKQGQIPNIPELRDDRLQSGITNRWAMEYLTQERRNDVVVIDEYGRLKGLLRLADIVNRYVEYLGLQTQPSFTKANDSREVGT